MICLSLWLFSLSLGLWMPRGLGHSWAMPLRLSNCATFHKWGNSSHLLTSLGLHHCVRKELPGGIHVSRLPSFGRAILLWLWVNENVIRNLSLTLEDIAHSIAKTTAAQQRSLVSLVKVVLDNRIALDCLLAGQVVCAIATPPAAPGLTLLGKLRLSYIRSLSKPLGFQRWLLQWVFCWLIWFDWFGSWGQWLKVHSKHWGLSDLL